MVNLLAGLSILIIGDSHLSAPGYLISSLHGDLTKQGAVVHTIGVCGAHPAAWIKTTPSDCGGAERVGTAAPTVYAGTAARTVSIARLVQSEHPNLILVVMGDTMAAYNQAVFPQNWIWQQVSQLTEALGKTGTACAWVGPAWGSEGGKFKKSFARAKQMSDFLASNVSPCTYIDSLAMSKPGQWPTIDGQHFTSAGYRSWGAEITKSVLQLPVARKAGRP
ncbi:SGNH/GDSL hydrolase family protein [Cupriavidus basilensis]